MNLIGWLPPEVSDAEVSRSLAASGIYAPPLSSYAGETRLGGALILGYTGFVQPQIAFGVRSMGRVVRDLVGGSCATVDRTGAPRAFVS
jgi:DNA-binding transcriptional MocR family regulator